MRAIICNLLDMKYTTSRAGTARLCLIELAADASKGGGSAAVSGGGALPRRGPDHTPGIKKRRNTPFGVNSMSLFVEIPEAILEERVPLVTTGDENPRFCVPHLKETDTQVIPVIASAALANTVIAAGGIADGRGSRPQAQASKGYR